jgi:Domain of unknown function (DUF4157)
MQSTFETEKKKLKGVERPGRGAPAVAEEERADISTLQHDAGNQALQRLFRSGIVQAKLAISTSGDAEEREADETAQAVLADDAETPAALRPSIENQFVGPAPASNVPKAGSSGPSTAEMPRIVSEILRTPGQPLDSSTRSFFEPRLGQDLTDVRVHSDAQAAASARAIGARAFTLGPHVAFAPGHYSPSTQSGRRLLAHELAHVRHDHSARGIMRKGEEPPLNITVPDPDPNYSPKFKYPWQNPELRKSIYPYRDQELSFFLRTYMEIDLENPSAPVPEVSADEVTAEADRLRNELKQVNADLKAATDPAKSKELAARAQRLTADLKYLPDVGKRGVSKEGAKKWAAYRYSKFDEQGKELDHDALLARIVARFDADTTFTRYPKWLRYMVFHFSGMRYQSAHGSYAPATDLVKRLKHEEIVSHVGAEKESELASETADAITQLEQEQAATDKSNVKRLRAIQARLDSLRAVEAVRKGAFLKKGNEAKREAFEDLTALEGKRDALKDELATLSPSDPTAEAKHKEFEQLESQINARETEIGPELKAVRKQLAAARLKQRNALIVHEIERADKALSQLDDLQALSVLKAMQDKHVFPDWVWKEIVRVTALKLETPEGTDWETVTAEEKQQKSAKDSVTKRWNQVMAEWKKDVTGWREKHGRDLSLVVVRAVCNEVCEMSLHARGVTPEGGIGQKARWYAKGGGGRSFSRPAKAADLKPGASLFFMEWSDHAAKGPESIVRSDLGVELRSDKNVAISDGFKEPGGFAPGDEWTYHFNSDKTVTRTAPIQTVVPTLSNPSPKATQGTNFLNWKHEAMVVEVDAPKGRVITFETGPIGLQIRYLDGVLNHWDVLIGFAESTKDREGVDEFLKDILPKPAATPNPPSTP